MTLSPMPFLSTKTISTSRTGNVNAWYGANQNQRFKIGQVVQWVVRVRSRFMVSFLI